jgi:hypothetical protein
MGTTYESLAKGTTVMFEYQGKIREGVVEGINRPTGNAFSAPTSYTIIYRRGQYTVPADSVLEF